MDPKVVPVLVNRLPPIVPLVAVKVVPTVQLPLISNFAPGVDVPIPTFPVFFIRIHSVNSVSELAERISKVMSPMVLSAELDC